MDMTWCAKPGAIASKLRSYRDGQCFCRSEQAAIRLAGDEDDAVYQAGRYRQQGPYRGKR
ncbi:hypothetical protein C4K27_0987 [Pseudomonas chlororaphis subsp. chlororaphis]|nr:hypothetical protein C4K27_0987 [Pseudomonas chlororaphis subsp. chlororaphis]